MSAKYSLSSGTKLLLVPEYIETHGMYIFYNKDGILFIGTNIYLVIFKVK